MMNILEVVERLRVILNDKRFHFNEQDLEAIKWARDFIIETEEFSDEEETNGQFGLGA